MVKIQLTTNQKVLKKSIPTDWDDVTFKQYVELVNFDDGTIERRVSILLGIDFELVKTIPAVDIAGIIPLISFSFNFKKLEESNNVPEEYKNFNIGQQSWSKLEECNQSIAKIEGKDSINAGADIVRIYTGRDINDEPITKVLGLVNFFLRSYLDFINVLSN